MEIGRDHLSWRKAMDWVERRRQGRWGSGEGKAMRKGVRQPRGVPWRIVHQLV